MGRVSDQTLVDRLVLAHPNATTAELSDLWVAASGESKADKFYWLVRWPPGVERPSVTPIPRPASERARTPLVADLEARLAAGPKNPRPHRRVDTGNPASDGEKE